MLAGWPQSINEQALITHRDVAMLQKEAWHTLAEKSSRRSLPFLFQRQQEFDDWILQARNTSFPHKTLELVKSRPNCLIADQDGFKGILIFQ